MDDEDPFNEGAAWVRKCPCGRRLYQPNSYTNHINGCAVYKRNVGSSLEDARARYKEKKATKSKKGKAALSTWFGEGNLEVDAIPATPSGSSQSTGPQDGHVDLVGHTSILHQVHRLITAQTVRSPSATGKP